MSNNTTTRFLTMPLLAVVTASGVAPLAHAQDPDGELPSVLVSGTRGYAQRNQLPVASESVTAEDIAETTNAVTVEDALKYLPSVLIRRRYIGDTQAPMATRTTGINASARSLIYADGILLSTLVNNNNQNGSPQWFMVAPDEIERVDVLYGPFAAAFPGNSYGAVTEIATRMPRKFEGSARLSSTSQRFSQYGTSDRYPAVQANVNVGNRSGKLSWWVSVNHLSSFSQPVTYLTVNQSSTNAAATAPVIAGAFTDRNRTGAPVLVIGAGNLTHTAQDAAKIKLAYDISPSLVATYTLGTWQNTAQAGSQSYLSTSAAAPYFGGSGTVNIGGKAYSAGTISSPFSSNSTKQEHWMQALSAKTRHEGPWNWEAVATWFNYQTDLTRTSTGPYPDAQHGGPGRIADAAGTRWNTVDLNGTWDQPSDAARHAVSFGVHDDHYFLASPVYNTSDWVRSDKGALFSDSRGKTHTRALWIQDAWQIAPSILATIGGRYEWWRAYDGFNLATASNGTSFPLTQPDVERNGFSPKLSITWQATPGWNVRGSYGRALRFPTVGELYQNIQTGQTFTQANPFLKPEDVHSAELAVECKSSTGRLRVSFFEEHVSNALISQTSTLPGVAVPVSFVQNVDKTRQRGVELVAEQRSVLVQGLDLNGSVTYVDARIKQNSGYVPTMPGATSIGKRTPYVPEWRATAMATYRPSDRWTYTLAARYSTRQYATVDNTDINPATYQGFQSYFVMDARVRYKLDRYWSAAAGIDNLNNKSYFLFHPFPQRTLFAELRYDF
ncbi:TonB-dependent receptor [Massilia horti]|uniref:TonB-dependent receptor n=1 Tax=Massilia horti TaxID=2562153 RepID=A0A4Y9T3L5_9BURK|nr:TonB-dependent receptor [Massilia horti]TFW33874.1 TonB-dependent receptor [Massilia horti]